MSTSTASKRNDAQKSSVGFYVYGIVPEDVEITEDALGVGDPPAEVTLVLHRDIGALISEIDPNHPLGRSRDLMAHEKLLDGIAEAGVPVLPVRFGAVLTNKDAVTDELLAPYHDDFAAALEELEGKSEYTVRARYEEQALLKEILSESEEIASLRDQARELSETEGRNLRLRLGEMINQAIEAKREQYTRTLVEALDEYCVSSSPREPSHEYDVAYVAFMVAEDKEEEFLTAVEDMAEDWEGRGGIRVLGPIAPYDFVQTTEPEA